jgi:hypothetical protein
MEVGGEKKEWIDNAFKFPGEGKIKTEKGLNLFGLTGLTRLPEGLKVGRNLNLKNCIGMTKLPEGLMVGGNLYLSENLNEQVKKDAKRLKSEGKIKGAIRDV